MSIKLLCGSSSPTTRPSPRYGSVEFASTSSKARAGGTRKRLLDLHVRAVPMDIVGVVRVSSGLALVGPFYILSFHASHSTIVNAGREVYCT
jgi:hypothetical protein